MNRSACNMDSILHVVSRLDVGRRVVVNRRYHGLLKYVGKIAGKEGIFCGIELDLPIGKHDGSYQNISYFDCRPSHGIFAPTFKVQLEEETSINLDKPTALRRPNKLIKSAIPALNSSKKQRMFNDADNLLLSMSTCSNSSTNSDRITDYDNTSTNKSSNMDWSVTSATSSSFGKSSCMENSLFSLSGNPSICDDLMMNSNHTYIVTDSDCLALSDIEICDTNLLCLDDDDDDDDDDNYNTSSNSKVLPEVNQSESIILEAPSVDARLLPVVYGSEEESLDEEAETPMVENNCHQFPHSVTKVTSKTSREQTPSRNDNKITVTVNKKVEKTQLNNKQQTGNDDQKNTGVNDNVKQRPNSISVKPSSPATNSATQSNKETKDLSEPEKKFNQAKSPASNNNNNATKTTTVKEEVPSPIKQEHQSKKPRISIREMIQQPAPVVPRQPKPPSKSQLIMERVKASIEADKNKLKKEAKSKLGPALHPDNDTAVDGNADTSIPNNESKLMENCTEQQENMTSGVIVNQNGVIKKLPSQSVNRSLNNSKTVAVKASVNGKSLNNRLIVNSNNNNNTQKLKDLNLPPTGARAPLKPRQTHFQAPSTTTTGLSSTAPSTTTKAEFIGVRRQQIASFCASFPRSSNGISKLTTPSTLIGSTASNTHLSNLRLYNSGGVGANVLKTNSFSRLDDKKEKNTLNNSSGSAKPQSILSNALKTAKVRPTPTTASNSIVAAEKKKLLAEAACLRQQILWNAKAAEVLFIVHKWEMAQVEKRLGEQLERVKEDHAKEINEKCDIFTARCSALERDHAAIVDKNAELAAKYDELNAFSNQQTKEFEKERLELRQHIEEIEQECEKVSQEKNELLTTLTRDESEKVQKLMSEISSLKFVIDSKTEELKKLRSENHELQFAVETIPIKDRENQKITHKVNELKEELNHQRDIQKTLTQQLEECKKESKTISQKCEKLEKDNDMLQFKLQSVVEASEHSQSDCEGGAVPVSSYSSWKSLNCSTPLSSRHDVTRDRPLSSHQRSNVNSSLVYGQTSPLSRNNGSLMCKSLDSAAVASVTKTADRSLLSIYQEQGRNGRQLNTPSKIYAPDGTFEVDDSIVNASGNAEITPEKRSDEKIFSEPSPRCANFNNDAGTAAFHRYCDFDATE